MKQAEIIKEWNIGGLKIKARFNDGFATLVTNNPLITKQIYEFELKSGKNVRYNARLNACTQFYSDKKAEEILEITEAEIADGKDRIARQVKEMKKRKY
jgi:hypothetical protein